MQADVNQAHPAVTRSPALRALARAALVPAAMAVLIIGCDSTPRPATPAGPTPTPTPTTTAVTVASLTVTPGAVLAGLDVTATVTLAAAAPAAGAALTLTSSHAAAEVPGSLTVPAGATSATVTIATRDVPAATRVTLTATSGASSASAEFEITPVPRQAEGFSIEPDRIRGGETATGRVRLGTFAAAAAAAGAPLALADLVITLTSSHPAAQVPPSVTVPAGQTEATFPIVTTEVPQAVALTLTATAGGETRTSGMQVLPHPPVLSGLAPATGAVGATVGVTLTGSGFIAGDTTVSVGGAALVGVSNVTVVNGTTATATFNIHATATPGTFPVTVTTSGGPSGERGFTVTGAPPPPSTPTLTAINPPSGLAAGGTAVTLTGTNLTGTTGVTFGGVAATGVTVVNATTVTATTPAQAVGTVDVVITTPAGTATLTNGYQYLAGSTLTAVTANSGSASGGTGITLTGTGLTGATAVTFDGVAATSVNVVDSTTVTAVTPAHAVGVVDVVIDTPAGGATLVNGYTYLTTAVGQAAHGGTIAALNGGLNNLIAATVDNSTGIEWGGFGTAIGAGAQSVTDGASNTAAIVAALGNNGGVPYAAQVCNDYEVDSQGNTPCQAGNTCYNDWFLPAGNNLTASGQLNALFTNRVDIGGFANASYWSSTEVSGDPGFRAWAQSFTAGPQFDFTKVFIVSVRCVRAFTP